MNPCSRTAPCKTSAGAISKTATGGEIDALDPGGFGSVTITRSITIDGTGTQASILAAGTTGIIINIAPTDAAKTVRLRGISINGAGAGTSGGTTGIRVISASKVSVEDVAIDGFTKDGISIEASSAQVFIRNSTISNNAGAGINVSGASQVFLDYAGVVFNGTALIAPKGAISSLRNHAIYGNKKDGDAPSPVEPR